MKKLLTVFCLVLLGATAYAQEKTQRTEVVVKREYDYTNYYAMRFGFWIPKDREKVFTSGELTYDAAKSEVNQSAFGLDFHFRREIGRPLFLDFALQIWYSNYEFKFTEILGNPDSTLRSADGWAVLIPLTAGVSVAPIPDGPIQPYAMGGVGAYFAISGLQRTTYGDKTTHDKNMQKVAFGAYLGLGLDIFFTPKFGISIAGKYQFLSFTEPLYTQQKDFTGPQIMIGFATAM